MDFSLTQEQKEILKLIENICQDFDEEYWLKKDREGGFPFDFHAAMAQAGALGIAMPEAFGGAGLGITEAALMLQVVAQSGGAMAGASSIHMNIFWSAPGRRLWHAGAKSLVGFRRLLPAKRWPVLP